MHALRQTLSFRQQHKLITSSLRGDALCLLHLEPWKLRQIIHLLLRAALPIDGYAHPFQSGLWPSRRFVAR